MSRRMIIVVEESESGFRASIARVPGVLAVGDDDHPDPGARTARTPGEALERVGSLIDRELARAGWTSITTEADDADFEEESSSPSRHAAG